jgi:tetratricopeptide (TPR) repeat protein
MIWYARAIGAARAGNLRTARAAAEQIAAINRELPATRDYDWSGSITAQWQAAAALIAYAEGRKPQGIEMLRTAAEHEDNIDKHPVTPGALLPVREILADLLMEIGDAAAALHEYESVLKAAPRRFHATAGAAKAAYSAGDQVKARAYALALLEIAREAEVARPELTWARSLLK